MVWGLSKKIIISTWAGVVSKSAITAAFDLSLVTKLHDRALTTTQFNFVRPLYWIHAYIYIYMYTDMDGCPENGEIPPNRTHALWKHQVPLLGV